MLSEDHRDTPTQEPESNNGDDTTPDGQNVRSCRCQDSIGLGLVLRACVEVLV